MTGPTASRRRPWLSAVSTAVPAALPIGLAWLAIAILVWSFGHTSILEDLVFLATSSDTARAQAADRMELRTLAYAMTVPAAVTTAWLVWRARGNKHIPRVPWAGLVIALVGVPYLLLPTFEYRHPFIAGALIIGLCATFATTLAWGVELYAPRAWDITNRTAWWLVLGAFATFVGVMGFIAHWRFITFHAEPYDMSWEVNAIHGIVRTGIPRDSVGAGSYYLAPPLPANYANLHCPWVYYLHAPFYALFPDGRTLLWTQAVHLGAGALGVYPFARRMLGRRWLGVVMAIAYLCTPHVQGFCLHDVHANPLAIPSMLIALGLMASGRPWWAFAAAMVTALSREETGVYAACVGLYWAFGSGNTRSKRVGWLVTVMSIAILLVTTKVVMVAAGGEPRYGQFNFYFDDTKSMGSLLRSVLLNPLGFANLVMEPLRLEYAWLSLLPMGMLALLGMRAGVFLLIPIGLLIPTANSAFFAAGINYGAPIVPTAIVMSIVGAREWLLLRRRMRGTNQTVTRAALGSYVLCAAVLGNYFYGNIFAKSYKLEYGQLPYRRANQHDYLGVVGYVDSLPAYGERERMLWDVIAHVPKGAPIVTSWSINAQLSNRDVSMIYNQTGFDGPVGGLAKYVVLDRLPPVAEATEKLEADVRNSGAFKVIYENRYGVIFERTR